MLWTYACPGHIRGLFQCLCPFCCVLSMITQQALNPVNSRAFESLLFHVQPFPSGLCLHGATMMLSYCNCWFSRPQWWMCGLRSFGLSREGLPINIRDIMMSAAGPSQLMFYIQVKAWMPAGVRPTGFLPCSSQHPGIIGG